MENKQRVLLVGGAIGALLGAGVAYLLATAPSESEADEKPITAGDLISLTGAAAVIVRKVDDLRRKL
jgi:gas vesicle protein